MSIVSSQFRSLPLTKSIRFVIGYGLTPWRSLGNSTILVRLCVFSTVYPDQCSLQLLFKARRDGFLFWTAQVRTIFKSTRVWLIVQGTDAERTSASHQHGTKLADIAPEGVTDDEHV